MIKPIRKKKVNPWTGAILFMGEKFIYIIKEEKSRMTSLDVMSYELKVPSYRL
jgi:hypothetical protein